MKEKNLGKFRLEIELVPKTIWWSNVRKLVSKEAWDKIRREQYKKAGYNCEICGAEKELHCHEKWEYDDEKHEQKLVGFVALCKNCHMIKHAGFSMYTQKGRELYDREELIRHFCKVNNCNKNDFIKHEDEAFRKWRERSGHNWKQDLAIISQCIK